MKKVSLAIIAFMLLLTACSSDRVLDAPPPESTAERTATASEPPVTAITDHSETESVKSADLEPMINIETLEAEMEIAENNMETSIRLFDKISVERGNSMFSPLSLNMALGLLEAGADGSSKAELDRYLGTESYADFAQGYMEKVRENYNSQEYAGEEYRNLFEIANSFWADNTLPLKPEYRDGISEKFGAEIRNLNFGNKEETLNTVNGWIDEKTHELIPQALGDYGENDVAILVNTVYFESGWWNEWSYYEDRTQDFTLPDGSTKRMPLMENGLGAYYENDMATAFGAGYRNGMSFIGILPKNKGDFTLEELDIPSLLESESHMYDVRARMPRLNFETDIPLTDLLKSAGLGDIFDKDKADFSGISEQQLFVSEVLQKTKLELDEYGTRAAAVTIELAAARALREQKKVYLDRPFAFLIYDEEEEQIVFIGKVTDP
ncbi:MAG: serpin family protein [Oscillospiraceae bacterium]|nr:serpin family protein [Oscillospiraceae bacterium]